MFLLASYGHFLLCRGLSNQPPTSWAWLAGKQPPREREREPVVKKEMEDLNINKVMFIDW